MRTKAGLGCGKWAPSILRDANGQVLAYFGGKYASESKTLTPTVYGHRREWMAVQEYFRP